MTTTVLHTLVVHRKRLEALRDDLRKIKSNELNNEARFDNDDEDAAYVKGVEETAEEVIWRLEEELCHIDKRILQEQDEEIKK